MAVRNRTELEYFLSTFREHLYGEGVRELPEEYLLKLYETDKQRLVEVARESLNYVHNYRGLDECVCKVALKVDDVELSDIIEKAALTRFQDRHTRTAFVITAMLLGSKRVEGRFGEEFEEAFSCGLDSLEYDDLMVVAYLQIVALLRNLRLLSSVERLLSLKETQWHRKRASSRHKRSFRLERSLARRDLESVKFAEAVYHYLTDGPTYLREYIEQVGDREGRAYPYLFCLACNRAEDDFEYFAEYYDAQKDIRLKGICIEAMLYIGPCAKVNNFLERELGRFDLGKELNKHSLDLKVLMVFTYNPLLYQLLSVCYYLRGIESPKLMGSLELITQARDKWLSSLAIGVLKHHGLTRCLKERRTSSYVHAQGPLQADNELLYLASKAGLLKR